jgi:hypothetical protein
MNAISAYLRKVEDALKAGNNQADAPARGSPNYIVTQKGVPLGYVEAKDAVIDLDRTEECEQLKRYRASLRNLILTD